MREQDPLLLVFYKWNVALWEQAEASRSLLKSLFSPVGSETCKTSICCSLQVRYCLQTYLSLLGLLP